MLKMGYDAVRNDRYKYIRYRELDGMNELYDLRAGSVRAPEPHRLALVHRPAAPDGRRAGRVAVGQAARPAVTPGKLSLSSARASAKRQPTGP